LIGFSAAAMIVTAWVLGWLPAWLAAPFLLFALSWAALLGHTFWLAYALLAPALLIRWCMEAVERLRRGRS
jgi:hypothetical protein